MKFYPPDQLPPMRRRPPDDSCRPEAAPPIRKWPRQLMIVVIYVAVGLLVAAAGMWWSDSDLWVCAPLVAAAVGLHHATTRDWGVPSSAERGHGPVLW